MAAEFQTKAEEKLLGLERQKTFLSKYYPLWCRLSLTELERLIHNQNQFQKKRKVRG
jgi:hypothetical protein